MRLDRIAILAAIAAATMTAVLVAGNLPVMAQEKQAAQPASAEAAATPEKKLDAAQSEAPATAGKAETKPKTEVISKRDIVEGYAKPDYNDLVQTAVVLGAYDIDDVKVAQEYAKQIYCPLFQKYYADDFSWNAEKKKILSRVKSKKEPYRVQYEYGGVVKLDRYDPATQSFPLSKDTRLSNVGHMEVLNSRILKDVYCKIGVEGEDDKRSIFPVVVGLMLNKPLTLTAMPMSPDKGDALLAKLRARGILDRSIFVRFRFRVVDKPQIVKNSHGEVYRIDLGGHLQAIDFFLDREMTMWLTAVPVE